VYGHSANNWAILPFLFPETVLAVWRFEAATNGGLRASRARLATGGKCWSGQMLTVAWLVWRAA